MNKYPFLEKEANQLRESVLQAVRDERRRQEHFLASGKFSWTLASPMIAHARKFPVLVEEVGEVAVELQAKTLRPDRLHAELIQVAALAVAWCEALQAEMHANEQLARGADLAGKQPMSAGPDQDRRALSPNQT